MAVYRPNTATKPQINYFSGLFFHKDSIVSCELFHSSSKVLKQSAQNQQQQKKKFANGDKKKKKMPGILLHYRRIDYKMTTRHQTNRRRPRTPSRWCISALNFQLRESTAPLGVHPKPLWHVNKTCK